MKRLKLSQPDSTENKEIIFPEEVWIIIWSYLDFKSIQKTCTQVSKSWLEMIRSSKLSWEMKFRQKFSYDLVFLALDDFNAISFHWENLRVLHYLSEVEFASGINFSFKENSLLGVGERFVLVSNPLAFSERYPMVEIGGVFSSGNLRNRTEEVVLKSLTTGLIRDFTYKDVDPWPSAGDGAGYSLVLICP